MTNVVYFESKCLKNSGSVDPAIKYEGTNYGEGGAYGGGTAGYVEITAIRDTHVLGDFISEDNPIYYTSESLIGLKIEPESGSSGFDSSSDVIVTSTCGNSLTQNMFDYDSYSVLYLEVTTDCDVTITIPADSFTKSDGNGNEVSSYVWYVTFVILQTNQNKIVFVLTYLLHSLAGHTTAQHLKSPSLRQKVMIHHINRRNQA